MEAFADESVNELSCMCSAQSAKTLTMLCLLAWAIAEDPGPILWVTSSIQEARKFAKSRLMPLLERCAPVAAKFPRDRHSKNMLEIYFPGAPLIIAGSESEASLQSTPFRYIFLDEARSYPPGAIEMVSKRTRSYPHNYKRVFISTPDMEQDAVHRAFLDGDQRHFHSICDKCGHFFVLRWGDDTTPWGLKWDTNEETRPQGRYNFDKLKATVRYVCEKCGGVIRDVPHERKLLASRGEWRPNNPLAPSNCRSFHWGALLPWWTSWGNQVVEFLTAKAALKWNDHHPLKSFVNETKGEPWTDRLRYQADEQYLQRRVRHYDPREKWEPEQRRFMTVDVQGKGGRHFYFVIRAWGRGGASRRLHYGKVWSWDEIRQMSVEWTVKPDNVGVDSGTFTSEVYKAIVESGYRWKALKGDDRPFFRSGDRNYIYARSDADPAIGTVQAGRVRPVTQFVWSKPSALDRLALFMHGLLGDWTIPPESDDEYSQQVTAYERRERTDARGIVRTEWHAKREDHYADCEQMQIICAAATELLDAPSDPLFEAAQPPAVSEN